jgi:site-specific DNA-cytosine methylase
MDRVTERPPGVDRPLGIDLFCGLGGLSLGMRMAGIEPAVGVDSWSAAVEAYSRNFPGAEFIVADVGDKRFQKELVKRWRGKAFVVCVGVPCQPFSVRNTKTKTGSGMPVEFAALACRLRPQYVVMEEVQSIATMEVAPGVSYLKAVEEVLRKRGYDVESRLLDASEHGVPQRRKRWFVVGRRRGPGSGATPVFPEPRKSAPIPVGSVISPPHPRVTPHAEDMIKRVLNGTAPYDMGYRVLNAGRLRRR